MKIIKTKTHVDNLQELRQRKAELKNRLDAEQMELRADWQELRADLRPSNIIADFAQSLLGSGPSDHLGSGARSSMADWQGPLSLATDLLVGNARARLILKVATPLFFTYLPLLTQRAKRISFKNPKTKVYGTLRKGIASLRSQLKQKKSDASNEIEEGDLIQPS